MRWLALALLAGGCGRAPDLPELEPGLPVPLALSAVEGWSSRWRVEVPAEWIALELGCESEDLPLELHLYPASDPLDLSSAACEGGLGVLVHNRFTQPAIAPGTWMLEVRYAGPLPPQTGQRMLREIPLTLELRGWTAIAGRELGSATALRVESLPEDCGTHSFWFDVPPGASTARIDLFETSVDWSLYARAGRPVGGLDEELATRATPLGAETLLLGDDEPLSPGRWYLDVVDADRSGDGRGFSIRLSLGTAAPAELAGPLPVWERAEEPFQAAIASVVEVATEDSVGSGTIVNESGWVLTNAHVLGAAESATISVTLDPALPPVESFRARVEWSDAQLDLALLRIERGYYGQPLPAGYRLPAAQLGDPEQVLEGDPLWMVGYPRTGGSQNRVPRHLTHGVLSGLEAYAGLVRLKSDAAIDLGNSGGAIFDSEARLVAVPTSMVEFSSGQTAFLHPWTWIPAEWRARAGLPH